MALIRSPPHHSISHFPPSHSIPVLLSMLSNPYSLLNLIPPPLLFIIPSAHTTLFLVFQRLYSLHFVPSILIHLPSHNHFIPTLSFIILAHNGLLII